MKRALGWLLVWETGYLLGWCWVHRREFWPWFWKREIAKASR